MGKVGRSQTRLFSPVDRGWVCYVVLLSRRRGGASVGFGCAGALRSPAHFINTERGGRAALHNRQCPDLIRGRRVVGRTRLFESSWQRHPPVRHMTDRRATLRPFMLTIGTRRLHTLNRGVLGFILQSGSPSILHETCLTRFTRTRSTLQVTKTKEK